jgi:hypothetical protein
MELTLNLAWMVLVTLMSWLWIRRTPRENESRWTQFVALAVIILILFPAISMTDDLMAAQNLAETSSCQRKDHVCTDATSTHHAVPDLFFAGFCSALSRILDCRFARQSPDRFGENSRCRFHPNSASSGCLIDLLSFHISWLKYFL